MSLEVDAVAEKFNPNMTLYSFVHPSSGQGWKLELFDLSESIPFHYHKIQRQYILAVEGEMEAFLENQSVVLKSGDLICIEPGMAHSLVPIGNVRFFAIDLPGFVFPDDVYSGQSSGALCWAPRDAEVLPPFDRSKIEMAGYSAYELVKSESTMGRWSAALLEISDSPRHYHRKEKEYFIVVNGKLEIEINNGRKILGQGESVLIEPGTVHKLRSSGNSLVRVLCFSFPAFDPLDMIRLE